MSKIQRPLMFIKQMYILLNKYMTARLYIGIKNIPVQESRYTCELKTRLSAMLCSDACKRWPEYDYVWKKIMLSLNGSWLKKDGQTEVRPRATARVSSLHRSGLKGGRLSLTYKQWNWGGFNSYLILKRELW